MQYMFNQGKTLLAKNYMITPIKSGLKRPAIEDWQNTRLTVADVAKYANYGVGVLTGQGQFPICALDVDATHPELAEAFSQWCRDHLGYSAERVGRAPKILLVYRAESANWTKMTSAWFADAEHAAKPCKDIAKQRLEILGRGQQFVAYHEHPQTAKPYEWVDFFGGLTSFSAESLAVVTQAQIQQAIQVFEQMALQHGLVRLGSSTLNAPTDSAALPQGANTDFIESVTQPLGWSLFDARQQLKHIDNQDYDIWLRVGMALHHEFSADDQALALWDQWSSTASNYVGSDDLHKRWQSFGRETGTQISAHWLLKVARTSRQAQQRQAQSEALIELKNDIAQCADTQHLLQVIAKAAGALAQNDLALRTELSGLIRKRFKALSDVAMSVREIQLAMGGQQVQVTFDNCNRLPLTEFGNATRMLNAYGSELMYVGETGQWYKWNAVYWEPCVNLIIEQFAKQSILALGDEAKRTDDDALRADIYQFCALSQKAHMVTSMVRLAQSDPRVLVPVNQLDADNYLLGCANGAVDLRTGDLIQPAQELLITQSSKVDYNPKARCPLFEATVLDAFFGDSEMADFFRRLMGYSILGNPKENLIVIPFGDGSNGKSTILTTIAKALGDYAKMTPAETFLGDARGNAGGAREDLLRLRCARLVYVGEPDENKELKEGLVKSMTGGENIIARGLYAKVSVEFKPTWTAIMPTNHKPIIKGGDHGIWRRLMMLPFQRNYDSDPVAVKDPNRSEKLQAELQGVLAWLVRGALEYQLQGLQEPPKTLAARADYKDEMDLLGEWLARCCELGDYRESSDNLWSSWQAYAMASGELRYIPNKRSLSRRLGAKFRNVKSNGSSFYSGLRLIKSAAFNDVAALS